MKIKIHLNIRFVLILIFAGLSCFNLFSQNETYQYKQLIDGSDTLKYRLLFPENMKADKHYPLVLFLHGAGERGNDNTKQLTHGSQLFLNLVNRKKFPAIVVFPQCPENTMWTNRQKHLNADNEWEFEYLVDQEAPKPAQMVNQLVSQLIESGIVDTRRIYIMGLSMGGIGTLEFLYRYPKKYAGAIVICGGHDPELCDIYSETPIWFFHGDKDKVVPAHYSKAVYDKVKAENRKTKYTLYPEADHNSWDSAFAESGLLKWLFSNKLKSVKSE